MPKSEKVFKIGDRIKIIEMDLTGEPNPWDIMSRYFGKEGTIEKIDDIGQLHGSWGFLALNPSVDTIEIIKEGANRHDI